jgi:raffinose/stachyose/melibiose transport system permease protein
MRVMRRYGANTVIAAFIVAVAVVWLIPVVVVVLAGLKSQEDYSSSGLFDLPTEIAWSNFEMFFGGINILQKVGNSFIISGGALLVSIVIAFPVAFAVSVGRHRLRKVVIAVSVLIFLLPLESVAYPIYLFAKMIGMYGNIIFLIIPLGIFGSAFAIFLFANVMNHIPRELAEAAEIDGATRFQLMTRVMIPLMWPTILTVALLLFVTNWNEYLLTLLIILLWLYLHRRFLFKSRCS